MRLLLERLRRRLFGLPWQLKRKHSRMKWALIEPKLRALEASSLLDIGCNAGEITRLAGGAGFFAVGIDQELDLRRIERPLGGVCLGEILLTEAMIRKLPRFDAGLLLSVHHQWVQAHGEARTRALIEQLAGKFSKALVVEFAGLNQKYGYLDSPRFIDNDEASVTSYASEWLRSALPRHKSEYLGKTPVNR